MVSYAPLLPLLLLQSMWFASCANSILWFAFLKAMYRATLGKYIAGAITFKVTAKGLQSLKDSAIRYKLFC